mmetsp:Transcript_43200/g.69266  ORF Transcript_43200/g.69266 Transcript_43200/m.69266 type:complete len:788 (+) Transcript_43200:210-2573(+)|eukprot:CAMPEP_0203745522 /NCGR_PEP_ID=MMETSP0098-20131031/1227_1 /ASSEMBLY_ACC=CAM_ASM_000208 /TAXON_ID=96639 /ORGANISM=" , Strain NY0313808BC1" /LENGTH=787 /DNA_ID=CAMNT_0050633321 /DNA_START=161 /DNA_END=2524 /DNA_ORIENTATION=+
MGKKATKKLIQKYVKRNEAPSGGLSKTASGKKERDGPAVQTLIARQNQAVRKRKRPSKDGKRGAQQESKPKKPTFDAEKGSAVNGSQKKSTKAISGDMSIEEFLTGGFEAGADDSDNESLEVSDLEGENASEESPVKNDKDDDEEDDSEDESESEDEEELHKKELEELKRKDPKFYAHLEKEGSELLAFGDNEEQEAESEDEEVENGKESEEESDDDEGKTVVGLKFVKDLEKEAFENNEDGAIKTFIQLFRVVVEASVEVDGEENQTKVKSKGDSIFHIPSDAVQDRILSSATSNLWTVFDEKLSITRTDSHSPLAKTSKKWKKWEKTVKVFVLSLLRLMKNNKDQSMQAFLLKEFRGYSIYIASFTPKVTKVYLKQLVASFGSKIVSEDVRLMAFMRLRQLLLDAPGRTFLADSIKMVYLEFVRGVKFFTDRDAGRVAMQAKCLVELFGINLSVSYQLAFVYVRQLALHLRAAILSKTAESTQSVYSWQYVHCLRLWASVLSAYPGKPVADTNAKSLSADEQQLRSLIYPLVQITIGTIKLVPTARNFPLRFHCVSILNSLSRASSNYIPVATLLIDVLNCSELFGSKPIASTAKPPILSACLKLNKQVLKTGPTQNLVVEQALTLLEAHLDNYRFSIAFPEMSFPVATALRSFNRKIRSTKWRNQCREVLKNIDKWSARIKKQRADCDFSPANVKKMNAFLSPEEEEARSKQQSDLTSGNAEIEEDETNNKQGNDEMEEEAPGSGSENDDESDEESDSSDKKEKAVEGDDDIVEDMDMSDSDSD